MEAMKDVRVLRGVRVADGTPYGREIVRGTEDQVPERLFDSLRAEGYVEEASAEPHLGSDLRDDGPTVAEYVAAGYLASNYPPQGYASRSTPEEIEAAVAAEMVTQSAPDGGDTTDATQTGQEAAVGGEAAVVTVADGEVAQTNETASAAPANETPVEPVVDVEAEAEEVQDPLDHDGDGRKGGSLPKSARKK